jgi:hypothetical protein
MSTTMSDEKKKLDYGFKMRDTVEIVDLVNAEHLNGKIGEVVKKCADGRLGVRLLHEDANAAPKAIKPQNIRCLIACKRKKGSTDLFTGAVIPKDKDDPSISFKSMLDGIMYEHIVLIERGDGKFCTECERNLDGVYHLYDKQVGWLCEEHFCASKASPVKRHCCMCHEYICLRTGVKAKNLDCLDDMLPDGKTPSGHNLKFRDSYWCHKNCFECRLCGMDLEESESFAVEMDESKKPIFLCSRPSCDSCDQKWEDCQKANARLKEIQSMDSADLFDLLRKRSVPCEQDEENSDLVRKVVVTEVGKTKKTSHAVTDCDANGNVRSGFTVQSRAAPGADLVDMRCRHGGQWQFDDSRDQKKMRDAIASSMYANDCSFYEDEKQDPVSVRGNSYSPFHLGCMRTIEFWFKHQEILRLDVERFIASQFWCVAVNPTELGYGSYSRMAVTASLITDAMVTELQSKNVLHERDLAGILQIPHVAKALGHIGRDDASLYEFMNSKENRKCDCMQYVAMSAHLGLLRAKSVKVKQGLKYWCANCEKGLGLPKTCSGCKSAHYCTKDCQREHWNKGHKKECKVLRKRAEKEKDR